jgi:hypothetical protein
MDEEQQRYERARARVQALRGFYIHATAYVLVNIALFAINVLVGGVWWFYWPCSASADPGVKIGRNARCER